MNFATSDFSLNISLGSAESGKIQCKVFEELCNVSIISLSFVKSKELGDSQHEGLAYFWKIKKLGDAG